MSEARQLRSYYFAFSPSGVDEIDGLLERVAVAGKAFHSTSEWGEPQDWLDGQSHAGLIQEAASVAAHALRSARAALKDCQAMLARVEEERWRLALPQQVGAVDAAPPPPKKSGTRTATPAIAESSLPGVSDDAMRTAPRSPRREEPTPQGPLSSGDADGAAS